MHERNMGKGRLLFWLALCAPLPGWCADLLVSNQAADSVWRLSAQDGRKRGEYRTGDSPHEIAVSPDGRTAVVSNYGSEVAGSSLSVLDLQRGRPTRTIDLGTHGAPHGLHFLDGGRVVVTAEGSASVLLVDLDAGKVERAIDIGDGIGHMLAVSADRRVGYVSKLGRGTISRIDLVTGRMLLERPAGKGAEGIALRPDGLELWIANRDEGTVTVHDPNTLAVRRRMSSRGFPLRVAFTPDGRHACVVNARSAELQVFDARTKLAVTRIPLAREGMDIRDTALGRGALPIGITIDPVKPRAYVALSGGDRVAVVDTQKWQIVDYWVTGREPGAVVLFP